MVAGGKRLRPMVAVAAAQVGGGQATDDVVRGGVACELVHLGSLYHDDVIDESDTRRGVETVNAKWGNLQAILAGDFLLSRASEIAASLGTEVAGLLARTIGWLCEGEIEQLRHTYDVRRPEDSYFVSIQGKTASLYGTRGAHRRHRRRARSPDHRRADGVGQRLRDGVPDRRRHPRHHRHHRAARQAGRPRPRRGRLHAARCCGRWPWSSGVGEELASLLGRPLDVAERDKALAIVRANEGVESAAGTARQYVTAAEEACDDLPRASPPTPCAPPPAPCSRARSSPPEPAGAPASGASVLAHGRQTPSRPEWCTP